MSAAEHVVRMMLATIAMLVVGTIAVMGFQFIEPIYGVLGEPNSSLGWGDPGLNALAMASFGLIGLLLVIVIWFVGAPIRNDRRQQYR